jgi:hypothetical protein
MSRVSDFSTIVRRAHSLSRVGSVLRRIAIWTAALLLIIIVSKADSAPAAALASPTQWFPALNEGATNGCRRYPGFAAELGFTERSVFSTSDRFRKGLILYKGDPARPERVYQHPSWSTGGWLGATSFDHEGNAWLAPAPKVDVHTNPPEQQRVLYRVDATTQLMVQAATIASRAAAQQLRAVDYEQNPYGILGLTFDCDLKALYVSSVSGSTRQSEIGGIFRVNPRTQSVEQVMAGVDVLGLATRNESGRKRLYFARARRSVIESVELDAAGGVTGSPRFEVSLDDMGPRGDDRARRITFSGTQDMLVWGIEFNFNLVAPTEKQETFYRFVKGAEGWRYAGSGDPLAAHQDAVNRNAAQPPAPPRAAR